MQAFSMLRVEGLPFPPSTNQLFRSGVVRGKVTRFKTREYRSFERSVDRMMIGATSPEKSPLALYLYFYRPKSGWFTKRGSVRMIDLSNRIKALEDVVFKNLGIDDSYVFEIHAFKCISKNERVDLFITHELEKSPVRISPNGTFAPENLI